MSAFKLTTGDFNRRVELRGEEQVIGAGGRRHQSFPLIATVWAHVERRHHAPIVAGDKVNYPVSVHFTMHSKSAFEASKYIDFDSRRYRVLSVCDPDDEGRFLEFKAVVS